MKKDIKERLEKIPNKKHPNIKAVRKEYGTLENFIQKAEKWLSALPEGCFTENKHLQPLVGRKNVNWLNPYRISIMYRTMTSVEHAEWLHSVLDRIDEIKREIRNSDLIGISVDLDPIEIEKFEEQFEKQKESALNFVNDVENYLLRELNVTEKQLDALNDVYERYKKISSYGNTPKFN